MEISLGRTKSRFLLGLALAGSLTGAAWAGTFTGPVSKYYLDDPESSMIYVVQGTSVVESFPTVYGGRWWEGTLAVSDTIRTQARDLFDGPDLGAGEYTLSGDPTGHGYLTPPSHNLDDYDGTTDGTFNYFVDHGADPLVGGVYMTDYYWQNPQLLFVPQALCYPSPPGYGCWGLVGIAYDPLNNSLWISSATADIIGDYSLDGTLLAEFPGGGTALGFDSADDTLWADRGLLYQYSLNPLTFGTVLQMGYPDGLPTGFDGYPMVFNAGDFQVTAEPEPATPVLVLTGIAVIGALIRPNRPSAAE